MKKRKKLLRIRPFNMANFSGAGGYIPFWGIFGVPLDQKNKRLKNKAIRGIVNAEVSFTSSNDFIRGQRLIS